MTTLCEVDWATGCGRMSQLDDKVTCTIECWPEYFLLLLIVIIVIFLMLYWRKKRKDED